LATSYRERALNSINKQTKTNDVKSNISSYRQRALNSNNKINQPTQTVTEKMDSLWVESTAPNVLEKQNINKDFSRLNISDFVNTVKNSPEAKKAQLTAQASDIEKQIKQKEQEYNRANNYSNWDEKMKAKTNIGNELNSLRTQLNETRTQIDKIAGNANDKLLTPEQVEEYNKNAPISQKIDKAIKQDIPRTAEKVGRTAMDFVGNVTTGVTKGLEGYVDAGIGVGGTALSRLANLAGKKELAQNIKNKAEKIAGYGLSNEMQKTLDEKSREGAEIYKPSVFGMDVRDATQDISRMISVGMTGGLPGLMISASGGNIEEALNEGESLERATAYGVISGSIEGLVEKLFDPAKIVGGGLKNFGNSFLSKVAEGTLGEGAEEGISQALNPFVKMLTYEGKVENPFGSWENFWQYLRNIGQAVYQGAVIGGLTLGATAPGNVDLQKSFSNDVYKAVEKIQGIDQVKKNQIANTILEGAKSVTGEDIKNIRQYAEKYRNNSQTSQYIPKGNDLTIQRENITGLPKMDAQNQAQTQNIEQPNVTLPTQAKTVQNANMEQIAQSDNFRKGLEKFNSKKYDDNDNIVVLDETPLYLYNLGYDTDKPIVLNMSKLETIMKEPKGTIDGKNQHGITMDVVEQLPTAIQNPLNVIRNPKFRDRFVVVTELTDQYGDIVIVPIEMNTNGYIENIETDVNRIASVYGKENYDLSKRDGLNSYIENNKNNIVYDIDNDVTKNKSNVINPRLQLSSTNNIASNNSINQNDLSVNTEYAQNNKNDTTYISPVSDIQSATKFVENATVNDIETLQQMVDEAEKNPDRIDLQFFAERAKKKIEYLTKSQRYQKNKINTLVNKLQKTYGLDKNQISQAVNEYVNAYNSDADVIEARETLLNNLNENGVLGEFASIEISNDIDNLNRELDTVKRYETDRIKKQADKESNKNHYKLNKETVAKLYQLRKEYQANSDKAMQKILLTKADSIQLDRLLKGEITFSELPKDANVEQIRKAYDAKKPLADVNKEIQNYNKAIKQQRNDKMRELTQNSAHWKDKKTGFAYARETQERNISDIASAEDAQKINKEIFEPIHRNEAEATRYKNAMRNKIKELNISIKPKYEVSYGDSEGGKTEVVSESGLVQLYGEGKINDETLSELDADVEKIKKAVSVFREIYNDLYNKTNDVLVQNGYAPVEFRKDYFPHFEETKPDTLIGKALNKLGFKMDTRELPTDIAGLTHTFRPGKKWVSNFLQRTTDVATYDAIKGFDNYLDSVADVIYHTDDIQNLRAYENALRYQHSDEVIKEQIDEIINMDIANEMKQSMIDQLYANAENSLAHYVTDLKAYTDNLAGKKSLEDRTMEHNLGRGIYNITKNVQSRVSANMVGANISSALTNFIPITQATAVIDGKNLIQATYDTVKNALKSDGFAEQSDFLTNRRGSDKLYKTTTDKLAGATNLMQVFDNITSEIINRGRYYQNVANGMNEADARTEADQMSGKIMADRSKGSMPTVFNQSSPVTKLLTAFQLEVNNQYSYLLKDIPREYKEKMVGNLVWAFAKFFIGAFLYNEMYEKITGRRAALDPINIVAETVGDIKEGKKASEVASGLATEIVEEIPFVGGLIGGGRLPISSALPDVGETVKAAVSLFEEGDKKRAWQTLGSELSKPVFYILPPFGGGQLKKTVEGISTYAKGGNYGVNAQGKETLKYPVEQNLGNFVKSALFGKWSTKGAVDYVDNGFKALSANQTEGYEKAKKAGITDEQFYNAYNAQKKVEGLGDLTSLVKKNEIDKATKGLTQSKRKILYETFNIAKGEWDNSKIVYPYEIKAQKEKIAREKLKTKKK
jgi:hypothetical protein